MKFIKSYKIFESSNSELEQKLKKFNIKEYIINEDGSIDCNQQVHLYGNKLNEIPIKFNKINDYFDISNNNLKSLKNCPYYIEGYLRCSYNKLESLEFGPEYVGNNYWCDHNRLVTLKGCIDEVYDDFICSYNKLTSLEFCPMEVEGSFNCSYNKLEYLDRSPMIKRDLWCRGMFETKPEFTGSCQELIWEN